MSYSKKVMDEFKNPKNMGELKDADVVGQSINPVCGDAIEISIKVKDGKIEDIKFQTFGCAVAVAMSSTLTETVKGKTLEEAENVKSEEIVAELGGLPEQKIHCSVLALDALKDAIKKYREKVKEIKQ